MVLGRKVLLLAIGLSLSAPLGACAQLQSIGTGISLATASITNPVTKTREAQIELAVDSAIVALKGYKKACKDGVADKPCAANIAAIQAYTRQMPPLIARLRNFVDKNDQVNAVVAYNQLLGLYGDFKKSAAELGYNVGSLP